jgi:hypothetical protein
MHSGTHRSTRFISDDKEGGSWHSVKRSDAAILKYAFPEDPVIDYVYRRVMTTGGDPKTGYHPERVDTVHTYSSGLVNCIFGLDPHGPADVDAHAAEALKDEPLAHLFNYTNIATARTGWGRDDTYLYFNARIYGGHPAPSRGTFVYSSRGRDWSYYAHTKNTEHSLQHNVVTVDGKNAGIEFGRMTAFDPNDERTLIACDLGCLYRDNVLNTINEYRLRPTTDPWDDIPVHHLPVWHQAFRPSGQLHQKQHPLVSQVKNPLPAHRVAVLVNEKDPYAIITDDLNVDGHAHHYRWQFALPPDLKEAAEIVGRDVIVTDPNTGDFLLVRLLNGDGSVKIKTEVNRWGYGTIAFERDAVHGKFQVLLMALPKGTELPETEAIPRLTETRSEIAQFIEDENSRALAQFDTDYAKFEAEWGSADQLTASLDNPLKLKWIQHGTVKEVAPRVGKTYYFDGAKGNYLEIPAASTPPTGSPVSVSFWFRVTDRTSGNLFTQWGNGGMTLEFHHANWLKVKAAKSNSWYADQDHLGKTEWSLYTMTYDKEGMLSLYINGELKKQGTTTRMFVWEAPSYLGHGFQGWIDNFQMFDYALPADRIKAYYRANRLADWQRLRSLSASIQSHSA